MKSLSRTSIKANLSVKSNISSNALYNHVTLLQRYTWPLLWNMSFLVAPSTTARTKREQWALEKGNCLLSSNVLQLKGPRKTRSYTFKRGESPPDTLLRQGY